MNEVRPPFNQTHPNQASIKLCKDVYDGSEKCKNYLVKAPTETTKEYDARKNSFVMASICKTGINEIIDIVMRNPLTYSDDMRDDIKEFYMTDIDGNNTSLNEYAKIILKDLLLTNKSFTNVWTPKENAKRVFITKIDRQAIDYIEREGDNPQISVKGAYVLSKDRYNTELKEEHKIYFSNESTVDVWRENKLVESIPTGYNRIPIVEATYDGDKNSFSGDLPPFLDAFKLEIFYWGETASRKHSFVIRLAIPLVVTWGMELQELADDPNETAVNRVGEVIQIEIGGSTGWNMGMSADGKRLGDIEFRELDGANDKVLGLHLKDIEEWIKYSFVSFIRDNGGNKTVEQSKSEKVTAESALSSLAGNLEDALNEIHDLFFELYGKTETDITGKKGKITVNRDFLDTLISDVEANLLEKMKEAGDITRGTYLKQLQENGGILKGVDLEEEEKKLEAKGL